jgi:hypothetical protein
MDRDMKGRLGTPSIELWHAEVEFDSHRVADFYVTLFTDPSDLPI